MELRKHHSIRYVERIYCSAADGASLYCSAAAGAAPLSSFVIHGMSGIAGYDGGLR